MHVFYDVNYAYRDMHRRVMANGDKEMTRNGEAMVLPHPMIVEHAHPTRRVLFDPIRNANPFFHYMEAIWMLSGANDVGFISQFAKQIAEYSDDGLTLRGAYGYRWRHHWKKDQLEEVIYLLQKDPTTRRAVMTMWDPVMDLGVNSKDLPCNTHIYFRAKNGCLNTTVCNRSNDLVWGMLGANVVHMGFLHEYIANAADLELGSLYQISNNVHIYKDWWGKVGDGVDPWYANNPTYTRLAVGPANLLLDEAETFVSEDWEAEFTSPILRRNALPMLQAWYSHKGKDYALAAHHASKIWDDDWRRACEQWLERRRHEG